MFINFNHSNQNLQYQNDDIIQINGIKYQKDQNPIGYGAEGVIYKGINVQTQEIVAIKECQQYNQRIITVLKAIKENNCSHIIGIRGVIQNQQLTIVMEYAHGEFYEFTKKPEYQNLSYQQKNSLFIQMVIGVEQLHQLGLFHRDLKPENFVYIEDQSKNKTIKLIDFGLVKQTQDQSRNTYKFGTPLYMAPEVLTNNGQFYNKSVDIWSLGVIWYELLVGKTFFKSTQDISNQIMNCRQEQIDSQIQNEPSIQQKEKNFIKRMLCKSPLSRVQLKDILAAYNQNSSQQIIKPLQNNGQNFIFNQLQFNNIGNGLQEDKQINRVEEQKQIEQETLNQMLQDQHNSKFSKQDDEKIDEMKQKREIERQVENEYNGKYKKLKDELENEIKIKENEIKEQQEKAQQYEKDIQQITEMKIQQEIQYQNDMEKFKKQKEAEYQDKIEKLKQIEQQEKEHLIQQKLKQLEENITYQIENKYLLEYNQKVIQLENTQSLQYQQQLEAKRQSSQKILQSQKVTINMFIDQLKEQLKILIDLNLPNNSQLQLKSQINDEVQKNQQKIIFIEQQQQVIRQSQNYEMLQEYEIKNVNNHNNLITEELNVMNNFTQQIKILEQQVRSKQQIEQIEKEKLQQLNKLKESFSKQFQILEQKQFSPCSQYIQKINEKINFYQEKQFDFKEKNQIQDVIRLHQNISQDLQILKTKEQSIQQFEQSQQINQYQFLILKLEELQQSTNQLKKDTNEINQSIQQVDINFQDKHQRLIDDLYEQFQDCQDKFKYLSKNLKYTKEIVEILNQTENTFSQINYLSKLLNLGIFQNYSEFNQTYNQISKQLQSFEKQYNYFVQQIYNDQQIELRNVERIKILETTNKELNQFIERLSNLKYQFNDLIYNQGGINEQIKNQIKEKSQYIDQTISEYNKQFQIFQCFNQFYSCETITKQIKEMESFQQKLKQQIVEETEKFSKLQFLIQTSYIDKSQQEKELFKLNNQLQSQFIQFSKALQSIKIACVSNEFLTKMLAKTSQFEQILLEQKNTLQQNFDISKENQILLKDKIIEIENKKLFFKDETQKSLVKLQQISMKVGEELEVLFNNVNQKCKQIKFQSMNNEIIQNYEDLQKQDKKLSGEIISINDEICNYQLNPGELKQLKDNVQQLIQKLNDLNMKIPQNNKIQEFNNVFKINLESYEIMYALVNYVKQFHITRYYERIKEHANKQKAKQQNQSQYVKQFNKKQEQDLEVNTQKEKEAQELLQRYYNILFNNASKMIIEAMENDQQQMDKIIIEQENQIQQAFNVKLKGVLKQQQMIKEIIDKQYYKTSKIAQMLEFRTMSTKNDNIY